MSFYPSEKDNKKYTIGAAILGIIALGLIIYFEFRFFERYGTFFILLLFFFTVVFLAKFNKRTLLSHKSKSDIVSDVINATDNEIALKGSNSRSFLKGATIVTILIVAVTFAPLIVHILTESYCHSHSLQVPDGCPQLEANYSIAKVMQKMALAALIPIEFYLITNLFTALKNEKK